MLSFGLTNAPATFQPAMNSIFQPHLGKLVLVQLDDTLVFSKSIEEQHVEHLEILLRLLREHTLGICLYEYIENLSFYLFLLHFRLSIFVRTSAVPFFTTLTADSKPLRVPGLGSLHHPIHHPSTLVHKQDKCSTNPSWQPPRQFRCSRCCPVACPCWTLQVP